MYYFVAFGERRAHVYLFMSTLGSLGLVQQAELMKFALRMIDLQEKRLNDNSNITTSS